MQKLLEAFAHGAAQPGFLNGQIQELQRERLLQVGQGNRKAVRDLANKFVPIAAVHASTVGTVRKKPVQGAQASEIIGKGVLQGFVTPRRERRSCDRIKQRFVNKAKLLTSPRSTFKLLLAKFGYYGNGRSSYRLHKRLVMEAPNCKRPRSRRKLLCGELANTRTGRRG